MHRFHTNRPCAAADRSEEQERTQPNGRATHQERPSNRLVPRSPAPTTSWGGRIESVSEFLPDFPFKKTRHGGTHRPPTKPTPGDSRPSVRRGRRASSCSTQHQAVGGGYCCSPAPAGIGCLMLNYLSHTRRQHKYAGGTSNRQCTYHTYAVVGMHTNLNNRQLIGSTCYMLVGLTHQAIRAREVGEAGGPG